MKYYLHDTNSFNDEKITELYITFGYEGLGLFYTILEKIAQQEKPIKTSVLMNQLKIGKRLMKCWEFMEQIGLIQSKNGETFNEQLLTYSKKYQIQKEKNAKRVREWRDSQVNSENVTHYEIIGNASKVNKSKVKESKVNKSINTPDESEFLEYCKSFLNDRYAGLEEPLKAKYAQWIEDKWRDGHNKPISNWKNKIKIVVNYLRPNPVAFNKAQTLLDINHQLKLENNGKQQ